MRSYLFIIPVAVLLIILVGVTFSYLTAQNVFSPDAKTNSNNFTNGGNGTGENASAQNTQTSSALNESENTKSIGNMPSKCLGSALCPDYDYYPSSF